MSSQSTSTSLNTLPQTEQNSLATLKQSGFSQGYQIQKQQFGVGFNKKRKQSSGNDNESSQSYESSTSPQKGQDKYQNQEEQQQLALSSKEIQNMQLREAGVCRFYDMPSVQYRFVLSGELVVDLRWVMQTSNAGGNDELNVGVQSFKPVPKAYCLSANSSLVCEFEKKEQQLQQFNFLPAMMRSLGTFEANRLAKLIEDYSSYVKMKLEQMEKYKSQILATDLDKRRNESITQAQSLINSLPQNEFWCAYTALGDTQDFFTTFSQSFSASLLSALGISQEEMTRVVLRKGGAQIFDWKTLMNITINRLLLVKSDITQRNMATFEGELVTFDGFRLKATIRSEYKHLGQNLIPWSDSQAGDRYLYFDYLLVLRFAIAPQDIYMLMKYRSSQQSKEHKLNFMEEELQDSVVQTMFLEKYYEGEMQRIISNSSTGNNKQEKKKKIRKTKAHAQEELKYFAKLQKNKFVINSETI